MPYFDEPVGQVEIQTMSKNHQRYYPTKRLIGTYQPTCQILKDEFVVTYSQGMRDRSMRSGKGLAREIQLTDWSAAGEQDELVFVV